GGDTYTLNVGRVRLEADARTGERYLDEHGPGFRGLYDLADPSRSRVMQSTGQSASCTRRCTATWLRRGRGWSTFRCGPTPHRRTCCGCSLQSEQPRDVAQASAAPLRRPGLQRPEHGLAACGVGPPGRRGGAVHEV